MYYVAVDQAGTVTGTPKPINTDLKITTLSQPDLSWAGDSFTAVWANNGANGQRILTRGLTSGGDRVSRPLDPAWPLSYSAYRINLAYDGSATLGVLWEQCDRGCELVASTAGLDGTAAAPTIFALNDAGPFVPNASRIAALGNEFVVTWDEDDLPSGRIWNYATGMARALTLFGHEPTVGSGTDGFAVAAVSATAGGSPQVQLFDAQGSSRCGPVGFGDAQFIPNTITSSKAGYLILSRDRVRAQEVKSDCSLGQMFEIDPGIPSAVRVARGGSGYAVVWQDSSLSVPKVRLFGDNFCN